MNERREFTRIARSFDVDVVAEQRIEGTAHDVSMKGLFVVADTKQDVGTIVRCTLYIDGRGGTVRVTTRGTVVRSGSDGMAIEFHVLEGLDSDEHLRRLLLQNAGDQLARMERELANHVGLKPR